MKKFFQKNFGKNYREFVDKIENKEYNCGIKIEKGKGVF